MQNSECVQYLRRECYELQNMVGGGLYLQNLVVGGGSDLQQMVGGGSDLQLTLAKYAWVGVRFAIYPSEKHLELVSTDFENFWRFDF